MFKHDDRFDLIKLNRIDGDVRLYETPEGNKYPSITTLLSNREEKKKILEAWRKRVGEEKANNVSYWAAKNGTIVHSLCENYLNNKLEMFSDDIPKNFSPNVQSKFGQLRKTIDQYVDKVYGLEVHLYSDEYEFAGTTDLIAEINGELTIVDFKTSSKFKKYKWIEDYFIQTTAYSIMFEERYHVPVDRIAIFIAVDGATECQVFFDEPKNWVRHSFFTDRKEMINA